MVEYGVFSAVVATAGALVLSFGAMLIKMLGRSGKWTWMVGESSPDVPLLGARVVGVVVIAVTYLKANQSNADLFLALAAALAIIAVLFIVRFNGLRAVHVLNVPVVTQGGTHARDANGRAISTPKLIGLERDMQSAAKEHYEAAKKDRGALSLAEFVSGYGPYNTEAIWGREYLSRLANSFQSMLMAIFMLVSVTLFIVALVVTRHAASI